MLNKLKEVIDSSRIKENVSMKRYTTFKTGGTAKILVTPENTKELADVVKFFNEYGCGYFLLGNGSNVLVSDNGLSAPVIHISKALSSIDVFDNIITVRAGASLAAAAAAALENSLTGLEFAAGIPGSFGGAIMMNAGAYGGEMKDVVEAVSFIDPSGEQHIASNEEMEFSYRKSALSDTGCIVTGGTIKLEKGKREEISAKMADLAKRRREKQPLEFPSAGSTFKRPVGNYAGTLIENAGLKGYTIGGAQVSTKHAGFIINTGTATTDDILRLIEHVKETVYKDSGILLEEEVKYWEGGAV